MKVNIKNLNEKANNNLIEKNGYKVLKKNDFKTIKFSGSVNQKVKSKTGHIKIGK